MKWVMQRCIKSHNFGIFYLLWTTTEQTVIAIKIRIKLKNETEVLSAQRSYLDYKYRYITSDNAHFYRPMVPSFWHRKQDTSRNILYFKYKYDTKKWRMWSQSADSFYVFCPVSPGICSSTPATVVRISSLKNEWINCITLTLIKLSRCKQSGFIDLHYSKETQNFSQWGS